ncbi:MAG: hypothetical protein ABW195_16500 [Ilumatobacteraceae bacterium]
MTAAHRRPAGSALEAVAGAAAGGALAAASWSLIGLGWPAAVVGAANGAISGARRVYGWRDPKGIAAFVLDSTWAIPMTAASLVVHAIAIRQPDRGGFVPALSTRANRHVYERGFRIRRGFLTTIGNTVNSAGELVRTSARRQRLVTDHEDVHVWQGRWFGPLYPLLYGGWMVAGGVAGAAVWAVRRRDQPLAKVVETCAYYLNPFEWWAYSRDGHWPPAAKVAGLGWGTPCVRPLSETPRRRLRPVPPAPPAAPG